MKYCKSALLIKGVQLGYWEPGNISIHTYLLTLY